MRRLAQTNSFLFRKRIIFSKCAYQSLVYRLHVGLQSTTHFITQSSPVWCFFFWSKHKWHRKSNPKPTCAMPRKTCFCFPKDHFWKARANSFKYSYSLSKRQLNQKYLKQRNVCPILLTSGLSNTFANSRKKKKRKGKEFYTLQD